MSYLMHAVAIRGRHWGNSSRQVAHVGGVLIRPTAKMSSLEYTPYSSALRRPCLSSKYHHKSRDMRPLCSRSLAVEFVSVAGLVPGSPLIKSSLHLHWQHYRWRLLVEVRRGLHRRHRRNWLRRTRICSLHRATSEYAGSRRWLGRRTGLNPKQHQRAR